MQVTPRQQSIINIVASRGGASISEIKEDLGEDVIVT